MILRKFTCIQISWIQQQEKAFVWILSADDSVLPVSSLWRARGPRLATVGRSCLTRSPCGAMHETGQGWGKEDLIKKGSAVNCYSSQAQIQQKYKRPKQPGFSKPLTHFRLNYREKKNLPQTPKLPKKNPHTHWRRLIGSVEANINGVVGGLSRVHFWSGASQKTHTCALVLWIQLPRAVHSI